MSKVMAPSEVYNTNGVSISHTFGDIWEKVYMTYWPQFKIKGHGTKWKPIYGFPHVYNTNGVSISRSFRDIWENVHLTLVQGQRSKVTAPSESPYIVSYMYTIQTETLSIIVFGIFEKKYIRPFDLGSRSKVMAPNESLYMISYMCTIQIESLFPIVFEKTADFTFFDL